MTLGNKPNSIGSFTKGKRKEMVTGEEVWNALSRNPTVQALEPYFPAFKDLVLKFPETLGEAKLGQQVTLATLMETSAAFLRLQLEYLKETGGDFAELVVGLLEEAAELAESIIADVPAFLADYGLTEADFVLSPKFGLTAEMHTRYHAGTLLIEDVLRETPAAVMMSDRN